MKRFVKIAIVSLATAVVLFAPFRSIQAQGNKASNHAPAHTAQPATQTSETITNATPHFLLATFLTQGVPETAEGAEVFFTIDSPTTFYCPNRTGCTLVITQNVEVNGGDASGNLWAIGCNVDSVSVCDGYWQGETLVDGNYSTGTELSTLSVTRGSHTVNSWVYSFDGLTLAYYNISYQLYIP
jgi:hypothetical protein